ncbi:MAG: Rieske 2Fe-2S domain-containing protein [Deltaproteobacteria bacterium]|nr:Rieske 2Fe-2S domain-containing protein [Deltaproteobacteria bacterium]
MDPISLEGLIIDNQQDGLFRVNRQAFFSQDILACERERIFAKCWIYAGHESEIPNAGDFRSRRVAGRPIILVRGDDGQVRVLLNTCTHRGALVCREQAGAARTFQCPYHAWTFNNCGELVGVPGEDAYSPSFNRKEFALGTPPRVESYRGLVFVNFNAGAEALVDYLAGAKEYIDLVCDQSAVGMEIVHGSQLYSIRANWKLLVENSIDGYHGLPTHQRYMSFLAEIGGMDLSTVTRLRGAAKSLGNGHSVIEYEPPWGRLVAKWAPYFGEEKKVHLAAIQQRLEEQHGKEWAYRVAQTSRNLQIFPNLIINDIMAVTVRTYYPVAPDYMEVSAWALAPQEETPEDRSLRLDNFLTFLGPGGFATPDDVEMLESCQKGFANREVMWSDISRGMNRAEPVTTDELQIRAFWRRWHELITGRPAKMAASRAA